MAAILAGAWLAGGDNNQATGAGMATDKQSSPTTDNAALDWARATFAFDNSEVVTDAPWAKTYRLAGQAGAAYLKILPQRQAAVLTPLAALAQHFDRQLPRLLALDAEQGWALSAEVGTRVLSYESPEPDLLNLVRTYARLQADAARRPLLFAGLPRPAINELPERLLDFLASPVQSADGSPPLVGAAYFIGDADAARYHRLLQSRLVLLQRHLATPAGLPPTINHGDLRPPNAAIASDGNCFILDWDDAMVGPAGMSLHGLFSGCSVPTILLSGSAAADAAAATPNGVRLHTYLDTLAEEGYADAATLRQVLPANLCAGQIQFILNFAKFPGEGGRSGARDTLKSRLSDLLDVCDLLAARDPQTSLDCAQDYEDRGEFRRAQQLLQDYTARHPDEAAAWARLAAVMRKRGDLAQAEEAYREALQRAPRQADWHAGLGGVLMERLELDASRQELQQALDVEPGLAVAREALGRVLALEHMTQQAALPDRIPILRYEPAETAAGIVPPEKLALGAKLFDTYGAVQIENAFPVEMIVRLQEEFMQRYSPYFRVDDHPDALRLGDKRYMLTVDIDAPFDDPGLIGAPLVLPIVRKLLGDDCVLGAFTAVISLPGSSDQRLHKDHPALFPDTQWHFGLPCFAAQIIIPLVPLDEFTGTTRFYKGTHRVPTERAEELGAQDPMVPLGSCLLNDYRCAHRGLGNRSQVVRPILTLIYNRPWFRDFKNYGKQPPLRLNDAAFARMPPDQRSLVAWWNNDRRLDQLDQSQLIQPREVPAMAGAAR
jgi:tetratricopeptide (TPR) repeat protein